MNRTISLDGIWNLRWHDGQRGDKPDRLLTSHPAALNRAIPARVPGSVHLDLIRAGWIPEPIEGLNSLACRWIEDCYWLYHRVFQAPRLKKGERAWLVFEALDLAAVVWLNGHEIGRHANAFRPARFEVTEHLRPGLNTVLVSVEAGLYHGASQPDDGLVRGDIIRRPWLRTMQSAFGWDWAKRLGNVGIRGAVRLEIAAALRTDPVSVVTDVSESLEEGRVRVRWPVVNLTTAPLPVVGTVRVKGTSAQTTESITLPPGETVLEMSLNVPRPALWWPIGHGPQPLYTMEATLAWREGRLRAAEKQSRRVGFRRVRVNQDPHPVKGRYFRIEINGRPIFLKGGNWVPADPIPARLDRARLAALLDRAIEAHFNFLRIWGGGLYEDDRLYEICDRRGILLWQEFIFACSRYPGHHETFAKEVEREAVWQVRRLAHHPSLIVWCGNNEIETGYWDWGYDRGVSLPCHSLFHHVLPRVVKREDGTRFYLPSSPYSPDHEHPAADHLGDQHPWSVGFSNTDFRDYRRMICRFPNEGGILGPTALPTVLSCLPPGQRRVGSFAWEQADNSVAYWGGEAPYPDRMIEQWLGRTVESLSVRDYVYAAGILQGEGLHEYIRNFRRRMFDTASAVFWMYNDCWPMVRSWTIVDYYRRRTPSFHPVRRAFQPRVVFLVCEEGEVRVYGVNDGPAWRGRLEYGLFALSGGYPLAEQHAVELPPNASVCLARFPERLWHRAGVRTHGAFALLLDSEGCAVAQDRLFLPLFREMAWPRAKVRVTLRPGEAVFSCPVFAWRVCLDLDGEHALPDNFFDLLPGRPRTLRWDATTWGRPALLAVGNDLFATSS